MSVHETLQQEVVVVPSKPMTYTSDVLDDMLMMKESRSNYSNMNLKGRMNSFPVADYTLSTSRQRAGSDLKFVSPSMPKGEVGLVLHYCYHTLVK